MSIKQRRFDYYDPFGDLSDPTKIGLLPNEHDYDLGTPNLTRGENVTLVAANSSLNQTLLLNIKWRPHPDGQTVTTVSRLQLVVDQSVYQFEQAEHYRPSTGSFMKPGRILTYGSSSSKLKLHVPSPYRRARITFNGHMQLVGVDGESPPRLVYVKLSCLVLPVSDIFDFYGQVNDGCLKQIHASKKLARSLQSTRTDLVLHDRHEQRVLLSGEFLMIHDDGTSSSTRRQEAFEIRGYHARHFLGDEAERQFSTVRLYSFVNNGQGFHIGSRTLGEESVDFGYTSFHPHPHCQPIDKPFKLHGNLEPSLQKFQLEVSGHQCTFECSGERRLQNWFKLEFNGKPGWAWMSLDDELRDSERESQAMARCRQDLESASGSGQICCEPVERAPSPAGDAPLVVSIDDECCSSSELVGAKAASLAQLYKFVTNNETASRYIVPKALVLTRFAHDLILAQNDNLLSAIDELKQLAARGDPGELRTGCKKVQDLVASTRLPQEVYDSLSGLLKSEGRRLVEEDENEAEITFAVRSSSWGEDETDMSAAGQLTTVLDVRNDLDELAKAAMVCFASKFSSENVEYKRQHGQPLDLPMAVVIQRMIGCDKAGVMFTCDPTNGDESVLTITANYGLGESVVSAQADPDSIRVRVKVEPQDYSLAVEAPPLAAERALSIEEVKVGKKEIVISGANGTQPSEPDRAKCCLDDEQILELARCGLQIKRYFWSQQRDIEWGYKDGRVHLFQSRPVTGLDSYTQTELLHEFDKCPQGELNYYTRANVGEVMPNALKPLTLSFGISSWIIIGYRMMSKLLPGAVRFSPQVGVDFVYSKFHALFNCRNSMMLSLDMEKKSVMLRSLEIGFFGREMGPRPDISESSRGFPRAPQPFQGFRYKLHTWQLRMMPVATVERELGVMIKLRADVRALKLATGHEQNKALGLYKQMCSTLNSAWNCWFNHIVMIFMATSSNTILTAVLSKYIKDPMQLCAATNRFLAIAPDVVSAEIPERVSKIAKLIEARGPEELQKFAQLSGQEALGYVLDESNESNEQLRRAFGEFMDKFGHRSYDEFEMAASPWREQPTQVVDMIQKNCLALASQSATAAQNSHQRDKTIDDVLRSLNIANLSFKDRILLKHLIAPKAQLHLALREKTKNILVMFCDIQREASRMLAAELVRTQRIPDQELIYYVSFDELMPLILDHQPTIVMQAVRRRQLFKQMFSEVWKFDEIFSEVIPNHLKPTKELDEAIAQAPKLLGTPASSGKVRGRICRVEGYKELDKVRPGTILLTHSTDIAFSPVFPMISGIITEVGGLVSHGAVVAREYGLPSLIGIPDVMRILQDDEEVILDADNGAIIRLSKSQETATAAADEEPTKQ